jgi:uncharacterized protein (TIGR02598 family)
MKRCARVQRAAVEDAFSLVEVTIAIGIAAFCMISIIGLLPAGARANRESLKTTEAAAIIEGVFADLRSTPSGSNSLIYGINPDVTQVTTRFLDRAGQMFDSDRQELDEVSADLRMILTVGAPPNGVIASSFIKAELIWPPGVANSPHKFEAFTMMDRD